MPGFGNFLADVNAYLADPHNRAFLAQSGASLLQPKPLGQTELGHIGTAITGGLEARERSELRQEKKDAAVQARKDRQAKAASAREDRAVRRAERREASAQRAAERAADRQSREEIARLNIEARRENAETKRSLSEILRRQKEKRAENNTTGKYIRDNLAIRNPGESQADAIARLKSESDAVNRASRPTVPDVVLNEARKVYQIMKQQGKDPALLRERLLSRYNVSPEILKEFQ